MAEFAYNNVRKASTGYTFFELNFEYYPWVSYKKNLDPHSQLITVKDLFSEFQSLMAACQQNLYHVQVLQKQAYNKDIKPYSYALGNKVWLNSK